MSIHNTPHQMHSYNVVCAKLVQTYPTLADDDEPGYVNVGSNVHLSVIYLCWIWLFIVFFNSFNSWKSGLRDRIKFL